MASRYHGLAISFVFIHIYVLTFYMPPLVGVEAYLRMVWWKRFILVSDAMACSGGQLIVWLMTGDEITREITEA